LDLHAQTFRLDGWLWFRYQGNQEVGDVEFLNAVQLEETAPVLKRSDRNQNYIRYKLRGVFKMDYHRPRRLFGMHNLGVSFRHRSLTADSIIYVTDELGMGSTGSESLLKKMNERRVLSSFHGWTPDRVHFFQDATLVESLGNIAYIDFPRDALSYSRFNFNLEIRQNILSLRGTMSSWFAMVFTPLVLLAILLTSLAGRWERFRRFPKWLWFIQLLLWCMLLLSGETLILHSLKGGISDFYLEYVLTAFDVLWFVIAAVFIKRAIEQFVWTPLETRTLRTIPTLVRRMTSFIVYLLAFFGIVAFAFKYKLTGLLATSGLLAMIIGLAVQMNISNIFSGIALSLERPFRIGDWIRIGEKKGRVVNMTWRSTRIETSFENVISIPNSSASETIVENYYYPENKYWEGFTVHIDPIHAPARVEKLLHDAVLSTRDVLEPWVLFAGVNEWTAMYWVYFSAEDYANRWTYRRNVWKNVWVHLNNAGIEFAIKDRKRHQFRQKDVTREESLAILEEIDIFQVFPDSAKAVLSRQMTRRQAAEGEIVIREGDRGDSLFIIVEGVVGVWTESEKGESIEITRRGAGDMIGETALLTGEARTATVKAVTDSILYEITKSDIAPLLRSQPKIVERLSLILAERKLETRTVMDESRALDEMKRSMHNKFLDRMQRFFGLK
ncbi:MAG: mechanosensitive ion channel, partial [Desulfobacterales bacterium]|nr:mechanosensitive ion channel [Desulfobacterales bacterium]